MFEKVVKFETRGLFVIYYVIIKPRALGQSHNVLKLIARLKNRYLSLAKKEWEW